MHAVSATDSLVRYTGVLPLDGGDLDIRTPLFTARLVEVGPEDEWAKFTPVRRVVRRSARSKPRGARRPGDRQPGTCRRRARQPAVLAGSCTFQEISTDYVWTQIATCHTGSMRRVTTGISTTCLLPSSPDSYQALALGIEVFIPPDPTVFDAKVPKAVTVNLTYRLSGNRLDLRLAGSLATSGYR